ncbi:E3 ubiquitin-protein ligase Midline-1-like [Haliotis asinina]|uniref:E3 ubiquitin-protein ligase Midline-1-like n=1 Tax=Haliotis asinina TaxID=109174 RepID=UPI00353186F9
MAAPTYMYHLWKVWRREELPLQYSMDLLDSPQRYRCSFLARRRSSLGRTMEVDSDLQCPICLELFNYPIILPCSHILCRSPCAENLFDFDFIRCPVCRDNCYISGGISSLPRVITLENIIDKYKAERRKDREEKEALAISSETSSDGILCQLCEISPRLATKSCLDCNASYCSNCLRLSHPNREPFTDHELVEPRKELRASLALCSEHGEALSLFCYQCRRPFCLACDEAELHVDHPTVSIEEGYAKLKLNLKERLERLTDSQCKMMTTLKLQQDHLKDMQLLVDRKRDDINMQCDSLLAEVENKRSFFLADLENEERVRQNTVEEVIKLFEKILGSSQSLQTYTEDILKRDPASFLEVASALNERISKAETDCESCQYQPCDLGSLKAKIVDFKREKAALRDLHYLTAPSTPIIDVTKCSRSEDAVALVVSSSKMCQEVIDSYELRYCTEEQKSVGIEDTVTVRSCPEDRQIIKGLSQSSSCEVLLLENLYRATTYYFCLSAVNSSGKSANSEVVQCRTLSQSESVVPVPVILETLCRRFMSSIQVCSSSPLDVAIEQKISHFLLYRPSGQGQHGLWKSVSLYGRQEHRVFGLEPNTEYDFVIMACNSRGECQLSNRVSLQTELSAI